MKNAAVAVVVVAVAALTAVSARVNRDRNVRASSNALIASGIRARRLCRTLKRKMRFRTLLRLNPLKRLFVNPCKRPPR